MACNNTPGGPGAKGCVGHTSWRPAGCKLDWINNPYGNSKSDAVDISPPYIGAGTRIHNSTFETLEVRVNDERRRRGYSDINRAGGVGTLAEAVDWNNLIDGINSVLGKVTYPATTPITAVPRVTVGSIITKALSDKIGTTTWLAGGQCLCNCNYCACNCNACTCNCNYGCTCNCNYAYSDETLKTNIEYI